MCFEFVGVGFKKISVFDVSENFKWCCKNEKADEKARCGASCGCVQVNFVGEKDEHGYVYHTESSFHKGVGVVFRSMHLHFNGYSLLLTL